MNAAPNFTVIWIVDACNLLIIIGIGPASMAQQVRALGPQYLELVCQERTLKVDIWPLYTHCDTTIPTSPHP